ncbi:RidA family protein [Cellulomonas timonensis]|uniref:RidA family protein n=1 Tax=Cellulomonas timonensis TaxID=1689271 RepID=UPI00082A1C76|nr:RidA family protein [Cellulomonas timonensis]
MRTTTPPAEPDASATHSARLAHPGLALPVVASPVAAYEPAVRSGSWIWTSGQLPLVDGQLQARGKVGDTPGCVTPEAATLLARPAALHAIAAAAAQAGGLDRIRRVVKLVGFVASDPAFTGQPAVVNGASDVLHAVFGAAGAHARGAVGGAALPLDAPVEIELVVELEAGA